MRRNTIKMGAKIVVYIHHLSSSHHTIIGRYIMGWHSGRENYAYIQYGGKTHLCRLRSWRYNNPNDRPYDCGVYIDEIDGPSYQNAPIHYRPNSAALQDFLTEQP